MEKFVMPRDVYEALSYEIDSRDLEYADRYRAYRRDDKWGYEEFCAIAARGCCGSVQFAFKVNGVWWVGGCNYGH